MEWEPSKKGLSTDHIFEEGPPAACPNLQAMQKSTHLTSQERLEELMEGSRAAPKESELCLSLGEAYLRVNQVDEAARSYQRAIELDPRSDLRALYWEWLGLVREMEGRLEEALEAYFSWLEVDPVAVRPLDRLGTLLVILGRWTDLKLLGEQYQRRSELQGDQRVSESLALYTFVSEEFGEGEEEKVLEATFAALRHDPDSPSMRFLLGIVYTRQGHLELARGEFERVLQLDSEGHWKEHRFALDWDPTKARIMLAKLAQGEGDTNTVLGLLDRLEEFESLDSQGLTEVAELLLEHGHFSQVVSLLQGLPGGPSRVERLKAEGLLYRGEWKTALEILETEVSLGVGPELRQPSLDQATRKTLTKLLKSARGDSEADAATLERLCRTSPYSEELWRAARLVFHRHGLDSAAKLSDLALARLEIESRLEFQGTGSEVVIVLVGPSGPTAFVFQATFVADLLGGDRLYGWDPMGLQPSLELARSLLNEQLLDQRELGGAFRIMIKPLWPELLDPEFSLTYSELQSVPLACLLAMQKAILSKDIQPSRTLCFGTVDLYGQIRELPGLEESLLWLSSRGCEWDRLLLARSASQRLLRCPAWLWLQRPLLLCEKVLDLKVMHPEWGEALKGIDL